MSEFNVECIRVNEIIEHINADSLEVIMVGNYPVCVRKGEFKVGDTAVYIPIDAEVPLEESEFSFLKNINKPKEYHRVKAVRLRGVFSMGLLIPNNRGFSVGQNVQKELGILKYEESLKLTQQGDCEKDVGLLPFYDLESLRKWNNIINLGENVIITEKLHGTNFGVVWSTEHNRLFVKSHSQYRKPGKNFWWKIAEQYNLEETLKEFPDIGIYGEVYGSVQSLKYGHRQGKCSLRLFDAINVNTRQWFSEKEFSELVELLPDIDRVPVLYKGVYQGYEWVKTVFADGQSIIANNIREGCVIHTEDNRRHQLAGRLKLKMIGEEYQLKKK